MLDPARVATVYCKAWDRGARGLDLTMDVAHALGVSYLAARRLIRDAIGSGLIPLHDRRA